VSEENIKINDYTARIDKKLVEMLASAIFSYTKEKKNHDLQKEKWQVKPPNHQTVTLM
jgi:hypothetical protein